MKQNTLRSFTSGILVTIFAVSLIGNASATLGKKTLDVDYKNLKVKLNGEFLSLTDANGQTVEPFAYNGTTYLPVRAIANALGLDVDYLETRYPEAGTVILTSSVSAGDDTSINAVSLMGFYKILNENLDTIASHFDLLPIVA